MFNRNRDENNIILAKDISIPLNKKIDANVLVYGNEEDGKYESYIIPNIYNLLGNYIVIDTDNHIFNLTKEYMKTNGYNIIKYDINNYNPLEYLNNDVDVSFLSNAIIRNSTFNYEKGSDTNSEDILFRTIIYYNLLLNDNKLTLSDCIKDLYALKDEKLSINKIFDDLQFKISKEEEKLIVWNDVLSKNSLLEKYEKILVSIDDLEFKNIIYNLIQILESTTENNIDKSEMLNLYGICNQRSIIYINPSDKIYINSMFFTQMMEKLFVIASNSNGFLPINTLLILDNFESLGYIYEYDKIISTSRSRHIYHSLIIDDWFRFRNLYRNIWGIIMGNISSGVFLKNLNFISPENLFPTSDSDKIEMINNPLPPEKCVVYQKYKNHITSERNPNILQVKNKYDNKKITEKLEKYISLGNINMDLLKDNNDS